MSNYQPAIIAKAGYSPETHQVSTEDGYILTMHKIPGDAPVVFCQHGLEDSSAAWVLAGPEHGAPAFRYSRHHLTLDAGRDKDFWQFTWDEMAKYDLPAELNYVLDKTGKEKIFYIGHSMGTATYMVMNSLDKSCADKVELAVFLAPVAYVDHMNSPIRMLTHGLGLVLEFGGFDWGCDVKNMKHHGSVEPPIYQLKDVSTKAMPSCLRTIHCTVLKVALFWGNNDWLAHPIDLERIASQIPNVVENYKVPWNGWNHYDFLFAIDIDIYQNKHLVKVLDRYPIN